MRTIDINYIAAGAKGRVYSIASSGEYDGVCNVAIDSRKITDNCLFFALIGERSDAHTFLPDVREKGCHNIVVSSEEWAARMAEYGDMNIVLVEDTGRALMNLAERYMDDWKDVRRVAVTGSVGKTSTKEFIYSVMKSKYKTDKTPGNYNSESGVPLTVFGFDTDIEMAVFELGAGYGGDIIDLAKICKPEAAAITIVGTSHLEKFGTRDKLLEEKLSVAYGFTGENTLVINSDCDILSRESVAAHGNPAANVVTVGTQGGENYMLYDICDNGIDGVQCKVDYDGQTYDLVLPVVGAHNLANATLAIALGQAVGIDTQDAIDALGTVESNDNRLDVIRKDGITVINDTYNASPESMKAGIDVLVHSNGTRRIAVLGDMFELGEDSVNLHGSVGTYAAGKNVDVLVTVGANSKAIADCAEAASDNISVIRCDDRATAIERLNELKSEGDLIYVKASRGMALEKLVAAITE